MRDDPPRRRPPGHERLRPPGRAQPPRLPAPDASRPPAPEPPVSPRPLVYSATDVGLVRGHNEDQVFPRPHANGGGAEQSTFANASGRYCFWAVADGMGGHARGEVASARALDAVREYLAYGAWADPMDALEAAAHLANDRVHGEGRDMGTTLSAVLLSLDDSRFWTLNVGDSRVYRLAATGLSQLTADHSLVAARVEAGLMTAEEAARSKGKNVLTRAIGPNAKVEPDVFGPFALAPGERLLVCSDGLHGMLPDAEIERILGQALLADAPQELVAAANAAGGRDNVSAVVAALATEGETLVEMSETPVRGFAPSRGAGTPGGRGGGGGRWARVALLGGGGAVVLGVLAFAAVALSDDGDDDTPVPADPTFTVSPTAASASAATRTPRATTTSEAIVTPSETPSTTVPTSETASATATATPTRTPTQPPTPVPTPVPKDSDSDGIPDGQDACDSKQGPPEIQGCPDLDFDGVPDKDDDCRESAGVAPTGCPLQTPSPSPSPTPSPSPSPSPSPTESPSSEARPIRRALSGLISAALGTVSGIFHD